MIAGSGLVRTVVHWGEWLCTVSAGYDGSNGDRRGLDGSEVSGGVHGFDDDDAFGGDAVYFCVFFEVVSDDGAFWGLDALFDDGSFDAGVLSDAYAVEEG